MSSEVEALEPEHPTEPPMDCGICGSTQDACDDTSERGWCCDGCYHLLGSAHDDGFALWLAQRDKDRDATVAAKVAEQIAQAIEAKTEPGEDELLSVSYIDGLETAAAIARAAAPAGDER